MVVDEMDSPDKENNFEDMLNANKNWPYKIKGTLYIIDAGDSSEDEYPSWAIGNFIPLGSDEEILVEFYHQVLKEAGITLEFEYCDPITLWVNPAKEEYFQVTKIENDQKI